MKKKCFFKVIAQARTYCRKVIKTFCDIYYNMNWRKKVAHYKMLTLFVITKIYVKVTTLLHSGPKEWINCALVKTVVRGARFSFCSFINLLRTSVSVYFNAFLFCQVWVSSSYPISNKNGAQLWSTLTSQETQWQNWINRLQKQPLEAGIKHSDCNYCQIT